MLVSDSFELVARLLAVMDAWFAISREAPQRLFRALDGLASLFCPCECQGDSLLPSLFLFDLSSCKGGVPLASFLAARAVNSDWFLSGVPPEDRFIRLLLPPTWGKTRVFRSPARFVEGSPFLLPLLFFFFWRCDLGARIFFFAAGSQPGFRAQLTDKCNIFVSFSATCDLLPRTAIPFQFFPLCPFLRGPFSFFSFGPLFPIRKLIRGSSPPGRLPGAISPYRHFSVPLSMGSSFLGSVLFWTPKSCLLFYFF